MISVVRKLGMHRRVGREAIRNAVAVQRRKTERPAVKMAPAAALIDAIVESDRKAPRKLHHTARQIFDRISRRGSSMYSSGAGCGSMWTSAGMC